ncbi:dicarboxylate/amino acid:cation symporter [Sphingomonas sp. LHG3443-2]|uniref:dicarboxylate/amino acid:cation symporter n=1 Tax=Sphingomonas sp. LHG3443-2 TaxID=2804639 RepID=UPI003CEDC191
MNDANAASPARPAGSGGKSALLLMAALIVGLVLGIVVAGLGDGIKEPLVQTAALIGGLWLDALRMTVIPLIVALLVVGVVGGADAARAGGLAAKAVAWFVGFYIFSAVFGAVMTPALLAVFPLPQAAAQALQAGLAGVDQSATAAAVPTVADFFKTIIPPNPIAAAANDQILPLVFFTAVFAFALAKVERERRAGVLGFFEGVSDAMLRVIGWVLWLAPIGVLALAFAVGAGAGGSALGAVVHYVLILSALGVFLTLVGFGIAILVAGYAPGAFFKAITGPMVVALSTRSSLASLPTMLQSAADLRIPQRDADVVLPLAVALFRATGPAMNIGVALYVAHWLGVEISWTGYIAGIAVAAMASLGAVSLPGQISFVTSIAPISIALGVPIEPLALLLALETIPDTFRTLGNVVLDVAVTGAVSEEQTEDSGAAV